MLERLKKFTAFVADGVVFIGLAAFVAYVSNSLYSRGVEVEATITVQDCVSDCIVACEEVYR